MIQADSVVGLGPINLLLAASQRFTVLLQTYLTVCSDAAMQQSTKQT